MQVNYRPYEGDCRSTDRRETSISQLVFRLLDEFRPVCNARGIRLELDLDPLEAMVEVELIRVAIRGLLQNALDSTPDGGEISVTSIDGPFQWEIEVADSSDHRWREADGRPFPNGACQQEEPVVLIPFPGTDSLRQAYRAAFEHEGQIQSWRCPQGGAAYALVVPRRRIRRVA
jgi:hypothetical protein